MDNEVEMTFKIATNITSNQHQTSNFSWHATVRVYDSQGTTVLECADTSAPFSYVARPLKTQKVQLQLEDAITDGNAGDLVILTGTQLGNPSIEAVLSRDGSILPLLRVPNRLNHQSIVVRLPEDLPYGVYKISLICALGKSAASRPRVLRVSDPAATAGSLTQSVLPACHIAAPSADSIGVVVNNHVRAIEMQSSNSNSVCTRATSLELFCNQLGQHLWDDRENEVKKPQRLSSEEVLALSKDHIVEPDHLAPSPQTGMPSRASGVLTAKDNPLVFKRQLSM